MEGVAAGAADDERTQAGGHVADEADLDDAHEVFKPKPFPSPFPRKLCGLEEEADQAATFAQILARLNGSEPSEACTTGSSAEAEFLVRGGFRDLDDASDPCVAALKALFRLDDARFAGLWSMDAAIALEGGLLRELHGHCKRDGKQNKLRPDALAVGWRSYYCDIASRASEADDGVTAAANGGPDGCSFRIVVRDVRLPIKLDSPAALPMPAGEFAYTTKHYKRYIKTPLRRLYELLDARALSDPTICERDCPGYYSLALVEITGAHSGACFGSPHGVHRGHARLQRDLLNSITTDDFSAAVPDGAPRPPRIDRSKAAAAARAEIEVANHTRHTITLLNKVAPGVVNLKCDEMGNIVPVDSRSAFSRSMAASILTGARGITWQQIGRRQRYDKRTIDQVPAIQQMLIRAFGDNLESRMPDDRGGLRSKLYAPNFVLYVPPRVNDENELVEEGRLVICTRDMALLAVRYGWQISVDDTYNVDVYGHKLSVVMVPTNNVAQPVLLSFLQSISAESLAEPLREWKTWMQINYGWSGPRVVFIDMSAAELSALESVFQPNHVRWCSFHLFRGVGTWLQTHALAKRRKELVQIVKRLKFAKTKALFDELWATTVDPMQHEDALRGALPCIFCACSSGASELAHWCGL